MSITRVERFLSQRSADDMVESCVDHVARVEHFITFFYPSAFVVRLVIVFVLYYLE